MRWRAGPLAFEVGLRAPPDWHCDDAGTAIAVDLDERTPSEPVADGRVVIAEHDGIVGMTRAGAWEAQLDVRGSSRRVRYRGGIDVDGMRPCPTFESFLRVVSSELLLRDGGALFHASSIALQGKAYLFCGVSGAGKTTLVDGAADGEYLSDDQSIVSVDEHGGFLAWGTPFSGSACRRAPPISFPLHALVVLQPTRPAATTLARITSSAMAARELARHVCAHDRSAACATRTLGVLDALVKQVPVFTLERHLSTSLRDIAARIDAAREEQPSSARVAA